MLLLVSLLALAAARASDSGPPSIERIRERMQANLSNIPRYTCTETIERTSISGASPNVENSDRIRVEVLMAGHRESVSWPGESRFQDRTIDQLVPYGTSVIGHFAGFLAGVFLKDPGSYFPRGEEILNGRRLLRYDYEVESAVSRLTMRNGGLSSIVGYGGSFLVDPETLDVVRLEVEAKRIPGWLGVEEARTFIDYSRVPFGEGAWFLLPRDTDTLVRYTSGDIGHNQTRYDFCRQYSAASSVRYGPDAEEPKAGRTVSPVSPIALPAGLWIDSRLESKLPVSELSIGDPIQVVLSGRVRERGVTLAKGTPIGGRITRLERVRRNRVRLRRGGAEPREEITLGLRFTRIGAAIPFHARLLRCSAAPGAFHACWSAEGEVKIQLLGPNAALPKGLHLRWETN